MCPLKYWSRNIYVGVVVVVASIHDNQGQYHTKKVINITSVLCPYFKNTNYYYSILVFVRFLLFTNDFLYERRFFTMVKQ